MPSVQIVKNPHLEKSGQNALAQAKKFQATRKNDASRETGAVVKDICGFFKSKATDRAIVTGIGAGMSRRRWNRIFGKPRRKCA